jgi:hypothetical protein
MQAALAYPCVLFLSFCGFAQTIQKSSPTDQDLTTDQTQMVTKLANLQKGFGKKMNSPGVDLSLREINRWRASDRTFVKYELYGTGLPANSTFSLLKIQISGKVLKQLDGITIASDGRAICAGRIGTCSGSEPNSPIDLAFFAGKAEPIRLALVSNDETHAKGFIQAIPFPNSITDKGCMLQSIIGTPKGELTYIQGSGFEPNEELTTDGESYGEKSHSVSKADADGSYFAAALPNVLGKTSGTTTWSVKGKNCNPSLTFTWGTYQLE